MRVTDLAVKDGDLVVGTNGRSIWILDDLTPLRQFGPAIAEADVHLYPVRPAVRYRYAATLAERARRGAGANPPPGAIVNYHLKAQPKGEVTLEVLDKGNVVRTLTSKKPPEVPEDLGGYSGGPPKEPVLGTEPGLHRVAWDLHYKGAEPIRGARVDSGNPSAGPLVNPGTYTVRLTVAGKKLTTKVEVWYDLRTIPRGTLARVRKLALGAGAGGLGTPWDEMERLLLREEAGTPAKALAEQLRLALRIRDAITRLSRTVEALRAVRKQISDRSALLKDNAKASPLLKSSAVVLSKLDVLEAELHNPKAEVAYDILAQKGGAKLYSQLIWLYEQVKEGDGAPTQGMKETFAAQHKLLEKSLERWHGLVKGDIERLNALARKLDLPGVIVPALRDAREKRPAPEAAEKSH